MAVFNKAQVAQKITNKAGGIAYDYDSANKLADYLLTEMFRPKYYGNSVIQDMPLLVKQNSPEFLAKALWFSRNVGGLRSVSAFLMALLATDLRFKGKECAKELFYSALRRPDDALEAWAAIKSLTGKHYLPKAFRKAVKKAFEQKWDAYQLRKYLKANSEFSLSDLVKMARPNPSLHKSGDREIFRKVIEGTLPAIQTAQTVNASTSKDGAERLTAYKAMLREDKLGFLALLRNIAKLYGQGDKELDSLILETLQDHARADKALIMPSDVALAYWSGVNKDEQLKEALESLFVHRAIKTPLINAGDYPVVLIDGSGSMWKQPEFDAVITAMQLIAAIPETRVAIFATKWEDISPLRRDKSVFDWAERYFNISTDTNNRYARCKKDVGYATYVESALKALYSESVTHIFILSDMQLYGQREISNPLGHYAQKRGFKKAVLWDLNSNARGKPFDIKSGKVVSLSGYSGKLVEFLPEMLETGDNLADIIIKKSPEFNC